jgi:hypothetical protein
MKNINKSGGNMKYVSTIIVLLIVLFTPIFAQDEEPNFDNEQAPKIIESDYWTYGIKFGKFFPLHGFGSASGKPLGFEGNLTYETPKVIYETHAGFYGMKAYAKILDVGFNISRFLSKSPTSLYISGGLGAGLLRSGDEKMFTGRNSIEAMGNVGLGIMFLRNRKVGITLESRYMASVCRTIDQNEQVVTSFRHGPKVSVGFSYRIPRPPLIEIESITKTVIKLETIRVYQPQETVAVTESIFPILKITDIPCSLRVEARLSYYPDIEAIISNEHYSKGFYQASEKLLTPDLTSDQRVYEKVYSFTAKNLVCLDSMIGELVDLYKRKDFIFDIVDKLFKSRFISTGASAGVKVTLFGSVRPSADMWYVQRDLYGGLTMLKGNTDAEGRFAIPIMIEEGHKYVYYVSRYVSENTTVIVYKKINVYTSFDEEIQSKEQFLLELGISNDDFEKMKKWQ